jgi:hypothetical protein
VLPLASGAMLVSSFGDGTLAKFRGDGTLDPTFGDTATPGVVHVGADAILRPPLIDAMGRIVLHGAIRLTADGKADPTGYPLAHSQSFGLLHLDPFGFDDHGLLMVRADTAVGLTTVIARLLDDGSIDTTFAPAAATPGLKPAAGYPLLRQADGGTVVTVAGVSAVARMGPDGELDQGWNGGRVTAELGQPGLVHEVDQAGVDAEGRILLSGITVPSCGHCIWIARLSAAGVLDAPFSANATAAAAIFDGIAGLVELADGHVAMFGERTPGHDAVLLLDSSGHVDPSDGWVGDSGGLHDLSSLSASPAGIDLDSQGRVLLVGVEGGVARLPAIGNRFVPVDPVREADTRSGFGGVRLAAGSTTRFHRRDAERHGGRRCRAGLRHRASVRVGTADHVVGERRRG